MWYNRPGPDNLRRSEKQVLSFVENTLLVKILLTSRTGNSKQPEEESVKDHSNVFPILYYLNRKDNYIHM